MRDHHRKCGKRTRIRHPNEQANGDFAVCNKLLTITLQLPDANIQNET